MSDLGLGVGVAAFLWNLLAAAIILAVGYVVITLIRSAVGRGLAKSKLDSTMHPFILKSVSIFLWVIVLVMVLQRMGVNTASVIAVLGAAGVAIGLALQGALSNVAGGILILLNKPFKNGDEIEVTGAANATGIVDKIDIMGTKLHTHDNKIVTVPNGSITSSVILNYTESGLRRIEHQFAVSGASDIDKVKEAILSAIQADPIFVSEPAPVIGASGNAEGAIIFDTKAWVKTGDYYASGYRLREGVAKAFGEAGISAPSIPVNVKNV
ncbi:MAG: mechanosensitive ion channel [Firmicutes bacterium]|nr:mechanosensitive ion channel [Bacillota bacterium]